jgi:hypothetical protein
LLDIPPEVRKEGVSIDETIGFLAISDVSMIAFPCFVVVAQDTNSVDHKRQPILETMCRPWRCSRQPPNNNFNECPRIKHMPFVDELLGRHVEMKLQ